MSFDWMNEKCSQLDANAIETAQGHQDQLTKPQGSLGRLEEIAIRLAGMQRTQNISLEKIQIAVFAGDHGIADEGVSLFPQAVTTEMIKNFARGGAAISVLARGLGAKLEVVDVGSAIEPEALEGVVNNRVAAGTANFVREPAMSEVQLADALRAGKCAVDRAHEQGVQLFIGGEMGIANTSAATAVACAILGRPAIELTGPGTGLDQDGMSHKAKVIQTALEKHSQIDGDPRMALQCLGGFEIAALVGAYIRCAQLGVPALVDGFITISAALVATRMKPEIADWLFYSHRSAEPGYSIIVDALGASPLLDLGMRLGEGSGAAVTVPLLRQAIAIHTQMATFADAGVSEATG